MSAPLTAPIDTSFSSSTGGFMGWVRRNPFVALIALIIIIAIIWWLWKKSCGKKNKTVVVEGTNVVPDKTW